MRSNLTFLGFLRQYVKELSGEDTLSIKKLVLRCSNVPKLREPMFLYAVFSNQLQTLQNVLQLTPNKEIQSLCDSYGKTITIEQLQQQNQQLPERILRVWNSYISVRDKTATENHIKELMRQRIVSFLSFGSISVYRISKDLKLNQGNLSVWLRHGDYSAISYTNAERVLDYVETHNIM